MIPVGLVATAARRFADGVIGGTYTARPAETRSAAACTILIMPSSLADAMTATERRTGVVLAGIFALRMLGLFLILPVFAVHARGMAGGDSLTLIGVALGAYGVTQALCQIPLGMASDRYGRKPVIAIGLGLFAIGSVIAALADSLHWVTIGRVVQGAGAISAAVSALAADLTREQHRTKVMAMIGSSIGLVFAISLVAAPTLYGVMGMKGIFWLTAALAAGAIVLLFRAVPPAPSFAAAPRVPLLTVLRDGRLLRLNFGIFVLHLNQMAMFVVLPQLLVDTGNLEVTAHWRLYLPAILISFALMVPAIVYAERRGQVAPVFLTAIALLAATETAFALGTGSFVALACALVLFFVAFNVLEATLPSLISRLAPPQAKGAALGIYNTSQAVGLALGGVIGGALAKVAGPQAVFATAATLALAWFALACWRPPRLPATKAASAS